MDGGKTPGNSNPGPTGGSADRLEPVPPSVQDLWGNGLWLTASGLAMLALGVLLLRSVGLPSSGRDLGWGLTVLAALLIGFGAFEFWSTRVWQSRLRARGVAWEPDRSIVPIVRSSVSVPLATAAALDAAYLALKNSRDRTQGVVRFSGVKRTRDGVVAYTGSSLGTILILGQIAPLPTTIRIAAESRGEATELGITVWPYFRRSSLPLAPSGEEVAGHVVEAIEAQVGDPLG